jgi:pimeloyl-ACP methyl ester carboxylesterase
MRRGVLFALGLLLIGSAGCSYLHWRREKKEQRSALRRDPDDLMLLKEFAPQDCFALNGSIAFVPGPIPDTQALVGAFAHSGSRELVGAHHVVGLSGHYGVLLPSGEYDLLAFEDLNRDGYFETDEVVWESPPARPVIVGTAQSDDGIVAIRVEAGRAPSTAPVPVHIVAVTNPMVVASADDPIFAPEFGEMGVYKPNLFMAKTQRWVFSIGEPDFSKAQVVLVHGIDGTPRDFRALVPSLDSSKYHVWLFYYPSGLRLNQLGLVLARVVDTIAAASDKPDPRFAIVAHSMGGLVGRRAVNELCRSGRPPYLRLYASFDTPYGGVESAAGAVRRGTELIPSWIDVASGSPFLTRLYEAPLPKDLPFHLFFGWGRAGDHGPSPAGDGTISLPSQLDPRAQAGATGMSGYGDTHVGILSDPEALKKLSEVLEAATGPTAPERQAAR